jgi:ATP-binding cassette subfamily B protein
MVLRAGINTLNSASGAGEGLIRYAIWLVVLSAASGAFLYLMRQILIGASRRMEYELRSQYFAHLQTLSLSFFNGQRTGDLMARATNDLNAVRDCLGPGIMYGLNTITVVSASIVLMMRLDPVLAILSLLPLPVLAFFVRKFASEMHRRSRAVQDHFGLLSSTLQETIAGIRVVQCYTQESFEAEYFDGQLKTYLQLGNRLIRYRALFFATMGSLVGLLMLALLWIGGLRVINGSIDLGDFVAFMGYLGILTWPFIALGWVLSMVQRGEASFARMREVLETPPEIASPTAPVDDPPIRGEIRFEAVGFRFTHDSPEVLRGVTETIPSGSTVAIVGRTGSGKTTLVSLIPRLFDPTSGSILLDGIDTRARSLGGIRRAIAVVQQEPILFSDSLRANLLVGNPAATDSELETAIGLAGLARDLEGFPQGIETRVGERGITLSGGQRQRVALARAFLADTPILILDDAFSSVDKITEAELLSNLRRIRAGRTTIVIAHRISTVRDADRILLLKDGRVEESGTHDDLLTAGGLYADMERRQRLAEEIEHAPAAG